MKTKFNEMKQLQQIKYETNFVKTFFLNGLIWNQIGGGFLNFLFVAGEKTEQTLYSLTIVLLNLVPVGNSA